MISNTPTEGNWNSYVEDYKKLIKKSNITAIWSDDAISLTIEKDNPSNPIKILDIGTGTGASTLHLAKSIYNLDPDSRITAIDYSNEMIKVLKENIQTENIPNVDPYVMDGLNLDLEENTFDYGMSFFGIFLFPNRIQAIKELYRVLKPGGKGIVTSWVPFNQWIFPLKQAVEEMGLVSPSLNEVLCESLLIQQFKDSGFNDVKSVTIYKITNNMGTPDEIQTVMSTSPLVDKIIQDIGEDKRIEFMEHYKEFYKKIYTGDQMQSGCIFTFATK
eukprot:gene5992-7465_t